MKHLKTFESFTAAPIPRAVEIENETNLMDKHVDKELSEEEIAELEEEVEEEVKKKPSSK